MAFTPSVDAEVEDTVRIRHAMAAGTAVALLSAATALMASATASAGVATQVAAAAPAPVSTASAGSVAGLLLGLLFVLAIAAVSFIVRVGAMRRTPARVISIPEARVTRRLVPAFAE